MPVTDLDVMQTAHLVSTGQCAYLDVRRVLPSSIIQASSLGADDGGCRYIWFGLSPKATHARYMRRTKEEFEGGHVPGAINVPFLNKGPDGEHPLLALHCELR